MYRIRVVVVAASIGAGAHTHHPTRLRHLIVHFAVEWEWWGGGGVVESEGAEVMGVACKPAAHTHTHTHTQRE